jgi:hypothetical protein
LRSEGFEATGFAILWRVDCSISGSVSNEPEAKKMQTNSVRPARTKSGPCRKCAPLVVVAIADAGLRREYCSHLAENGFAAPAAATEEEAIGLVQRLAPELLVVELTPQALAAATLLRSQPFTQHVGIVALATAKAVGRMGLEDEGPFDALLEAPCSATTLLTELLAMLASLMPDEAPAG